MHSNKRTHFFAFHSLVRYKIVAALQRDADLSGQSSCPRCVNLFGMWRVQRLDQINRFKPANPFDFKSLTLKFRSEQIGRFKTTIRQSESVDLIASGRTDRPVQL